MSDEVVVTGDGCLSALGMTVPESMTHLYAGRIQEPDPGRVPTTVSPPPPLFHIPGRFEEECRTRRVRTSRIALHALREALDKAWGGHLDVPPERIGVCLGTTVGCTLNDEPFYREFRRGVKPDRAPIRRFLDNELARVVADHVGARGPAATVVNACASGTDAIGEGAAWLQRDLCDVVIAGGADELSRYPYLGFIALKNTSPERCRPFDVNRKGLNLGEGAAVVVLERARFARKRGASILARLAAYASASDAYHPTAPHPEGRGLRRAIRLALEQARLAADEVDFINAHGTGTTENDRVEGRVLAELFPANPAIFSTKGYTGHTTGAAGALEAVLTIRNLADQRVPRSGGFETPDPTCLIVPTTETKEIRARAAISDSLAFGGTNSVLVFRRGEPR